MIKEINRRHFIKAAGAFLPLPYMSSLAKAEEKSSKLPFKRAVFINFGFGLSNWNFFPKTSEKGYESSLYLKNLDSVRDRFTVFHGLSHKDISAHFEVQGFLTGYPNGNSVSIDQLLSKELGKDCRFESIGLSPFHKDGGGGIGLAYNRSGVGIPPVRGPKDFYTKLFSEGSAKEKAVLMRNLKENKSILDKVKGDRDKLKRVAGAKDKQQLNEYYQALREAEMKLSRNIKWLGSPKPKAPFAYKEFQDKVFDLPMLEEYLGLEAELMYLALKTDSTRVITCHYAVNPLPMEINGTNGNAHLTYSHHKNDPEKLKVLAQIENGQFRSLGAKLILKLSEKVDGRSLLDDTMVFVGSNINDPQNHYSKDLPILIAGAGFEKYHGRKLDYGKGDRNEPLCNLYLTMLHKMGIDHDSFGISTGTLRGVDS